ncbi:MAG: hypothetical protein ACREM9_01975 [Gemmatimonadales bacterium]
MPRNQRFSSLVAGGAVALVPLLTAFGPGPEAPAPTEPKTIAICTPEHVFAAKDRTHVRCLESADGILFFAAPTDHPARANQVLQMGFQAIAKGGKLRIQYDPSDQSGANWGCLVHDCRPVISIQPYDKGEGLAKGKKN